jgi:hypothetical protein
VVYRGDPQWPLYVDSRRRSNISNAQIAAIPVLAGNGSSRLIAALRDRLCERAGSCKKAVFGSRRRLRQKRSHLPSQTDVHRTQIASLFV